MITEKTEEKHEILECFEEKVTESYVCDNGSEEEATFIVPQWINTYGIKIRRGCVSCVYAAVTEKPGAHTCKLTGENTRKGHNCDRWEANERSQKAGSMALATGRVQTRDYVRWKANNYEAVVNEYTDLIQAGMKLNGLELFLREKYVKSTGKSIYY